MLKRVELFVRYVKNFLVVIVLVLYKIQKVFFYVGTPFIKCRKATGKTGKLLKHANSENHAKALALNELFLHGKNKPIHTQMIQQSNSEKIQNRINFSTFAHSVYFLP